MAKMCQGTYPKELQPKQEKVQQIEQRALNHFIEDLLSVCAEQDKHSAGFTSLINKITYSS